MLKLARNTDDQERVEIPPPGHPDARILVVDDQQANIDLLRRVLERAGYRQIECLTDPRLVEDALERFRPDIILLDLLMPKLSGLDVLRALKADATTRGLPVLVLSNSSRQQDIDEITRLGVVGYFVKADLSLQALGDRIAQLLSGAG